MIIERKVDVAFAEELFDEMVKDLSFFKSAAKRDPKNIPSLIGTAWKVLSCGCVAQPQSPEIANALALVADAHTALFAPAMNPSGPVSVRLGETESATYSSAPDQSNVTWVAWIAGFYFNALCRKLDSIDLLCLVPTGLIRKSTTKAGEYLYLYMESLAAYGQNRMDSIVKTLLAAVKATDPDRPDIFDADWTLNSHVPQLEVLIYAVTKDAKFGAALLRAVQLHKKYWEKTKDRRRDYRGFISVELTALAALGRERGLPFDIESPYLPMWLAK